MFFTAWNRQKETETDRKIYLPTLESGIDVAPWINLASGNFGKKNKQDPIYTWYGVRNKAVAPGKKSKN